MVFPKRLSTQRWLFYTITISGFPGQQLAEGQRPRGLLPRYETDRLSNTWARYMWVRRVNSLKPLVCFQSDGHSRGSRCSPLVSKTRRGKTRLTWLISKWKWSRGVKSDHRGYKKIEIITGDETQTELKTTRLSRRSLQLLLQYT